MSWCSSWEGVCSAGLGEPKAPLAFYCSGRDSCHFHFQPFGQNKSQGQARATWGLEPAGEVGLGAPRPVAGSGGGARGWGARLPSGLGASQARRRKVPGSAWSRPSPGGRASTVQLPPGLRDYIPETHSERDKRGPGGLYLCVLVLGRRRKEKGRRRRRGSGGRPGCGKRLVGRRQRLP